MDGNRRELTAGEAQQVTGGVNRVINTGSDLNAAVRSGPSRGNKQIASLVNGTVVDTVSDELVYDEVAGRNFVEITFTDKKGRVRTGWVASSILGMKR